MTLLFRASLHGWGPKAYHDKCDGPPKNRREYTSTLEAWRRFGDETEAIPAISRSGTADTAGNGCMAGLRAVPGAPAGDTTARQLVPNQAHPTGWP